MVVYWTTTFRNRNTCKLNKECLALVNHIYSNQVIDQRTNEIICEYSRLIHWVQVLGMHLFRDINVGVYFHHQHRVNYLNQHQLIHRKVKKKASLGLRRSIQEHNFRHGQKNMLVLKQYNILEKLFSYLVSKSNILIIEMSLHEFYYNTIIYYNA